KIAQGTYGTVFRIESRSYPNTFTIGKILPLQAPKGFGSRTKAFTSIESAAREVEMLGVMEGVEGFVEFRGAEVLQGVLPEPLAEVSKAFDELQDDDYDIPTSWQKACTYPTQLWLFLEMSDAGTDLETALTKGLPGDNCFLRDASDGKTYISASTVNDVFRQVATALAIAEKEMEFEHRDLHLGNICLLPIPALAPATQGAATAVNAREDSAGGEEEQDQPLHTITQTVRVTIIDYTLSRARITHPSADSKVLFNDLTLDPEIFDGEGDLQYDVYRSMRTLIWGHQDEKLGDWAVFEPGTNVLWLGHLLVMLLRRAPRELQREGEKGLLEGLEGLRRRLDGDGDGRGGKFGSAGDVVRWCEMDGR
ncbi:MAG: hypothetical protein Q9218_008349, partial [Villophora microphyllina]